MSLGVGAASGRTFASLRRHRNYRLYFTGQVVSLTGTWVQNVAQAWLVVLLSHGSPLAVGALALCQFGPYAVAGLLGGVLADRLNGRSTLIATQSASMVVAAALAVLALGNFAQLWEVYLLAAANGSVLVLDTPVRQAFTIQMVGRPELSNAIALNSSLFNASRVVGPAIGGVLIATVGVGVCFLINATSFLAVVAALVAMRESELHPVTRDEKRSTLLRGIGDGLSYAWREPAARAVLLLMLVISTLAINFNVLLPVLTSHTLGAGPEVFGILSAAFGGGALVGALTSASLSRASFGALLTGATIFGSALLVLAPLRSLWAVCVLLVATGCAFSLYTSQSNATLQLMVPDRLRGRVLSLYAYVFFGTAPLGGLFTGWLCGRMGTAVYLIVAGGISVIAALVTAGLRLQQGEHRLRATLRHPLRHADPSTVGARE